MAGAIPYRPVCVSYLRVRSTNRIPSSLASLLRVDLWRVEAVIGQDKEMKGMGFRVPELDQATRWDKDEIWGKLAALANTTFAFYDKAHDYGEPGLARGITFGWHSGTEVDQPEALGFIRISLYLFRGLLDPRIRAAEKAALRFTFAVTVSPYMCLHIEAPNTCL